MKSSKALWIVLGILGALGTCCLSCLVVGAVSDDGKGGAALLATGGGSSLPDGHYNCVAITTSMRNGSMWTDANPAAPFDVSGGRYTTSGGGGTVTLVGEVATFEGTDQNGWRGLTNADQSVVAFRFSDPTDPPGGLASGNLIRCERR